MYQTSPLEVQQKIGEQTVREGRLYDMTPDGMVPPHIERIMIEEGEEIEEIHDPRRRASYDRVDW